VSEDRHAYTDNIHVEDVLRGMYDKHTTKVTADTMTCHCGAFDRR
jgi:hypothetical protein